MDCTEMYIAISNAPIKTECNIELFDGAIGKEHLPYAILALAVLILPPVMLLLLYPMICFQNCNYLTRCRLHAYNHTLQIP